MLLFTKLFSSYILSFLLCGFFLSPLSPCSLTYFILPICSHFLMPPTPIILNSVHPQTGFANGKEKAPDKALLWDKALHRVVNGDWGPACGAENGNSSGALPQKAIRLHRLESWIKPCDFKAFMADKDLLISNFLTNYNHKELRTIISEQNETALGSSLCRFHSWGLAASVQLGLCFSK